jgi:hypothetical protein
MPIYTIPLAVAATTAYASLLEWAVHRFGYHDGRVWARATAAHAAHHDTLYPARRFFERGDRYRTSQPAWLEVLYVVAHAPAFLAVAAFSRAAAVAAAATLALYAAATHYLHPLTHCRTGRFWERTRLFKRLVARHVRHHQDESIHLNLLVPLGDWIFGTMDRGRSGSGSSAIGTGTGSGVIGPTDRVVRSARGRAGSHRAA